MLKQIEIKKGTKILSVILGTLMGGFMWRCRGESGFGSSWGLYSVGLVLMLLIYFVYGQRQKMKYELIPLGAFLLGLGVTGYATVFDQLAGVVASDLPYQGQEVYSPVNPYSGVLIFFIMGLTFTPFFSFFIGTLFSDKEYKLVHYIGAIAVFFIVSNVCKATISQPILAFINPDQVKYAALGLADRGFDYASPAKAYMAHFLDRDWAQEIPYFENYYMSLEHISDLIAAVCVGIYPLIIKKDKLPLITSIVISSYTAVATTAFGFLYAVSFDTGFLGDVVPVRALENGAGWSIWEFATGASVGFITMLVIALLPKKYSSKNNIDVAPLENNKIISLIFNIIATVFIFALTPMRAVGIRIGKLLYNEGLLEDDSPTGDIIMIVLTVALGVFLVIKIVKNIMKNNTTPLGVNPVEFSRKALPAYFGMCVVLYFFTNHAPVLHLPYGEMTSLYKFAYIMTDTENFETLLMFITFVLITIIFIPFSRKIYPKEK